MKTTLLVSLLALSVAACGGNKAANNQNANAAAGNNQAASASINTAAPVAATGGALTPPELRTMVQRDGAPATVRTLSQGGTEAAPNRYATFERGVGSGEQAWLDLVPLIRPGTDGETGEGLTMMLQEALSKNAAGVLRLIGSGEDAEGICGESATETVRGDRAAAITAVEAVTDPALAQAKTSCLAALRATAAR
jgi:hypothetical protein